MAGFGKKKTITEYLYSKIVVVLLLIFVVFLTVSVLERYRVERQMAERKDEALEHKEELIERKKMLEEKVKYLGAERGVEAEIRTNFDVAKEGEKVIILVGDTKESESEATTTVAVKPWYIFW